MAQLQTNVSFGIPLKKLVLTLSVIYMIFYLGVSLYFLAIAVMFTVMKGGKDVPGYPYDEKVFYAIALLAFLNFGLNFGLWHGALKRRRLLCFIWLERTSLDSFCIFVHLMCGEHLSHYITITEICLLILNVYAAWTVWNFTKEIAEHNQLSLPSFVNSDYDGNGKNMTLKFQLQPVLLMAAGDTHVGIGNTLQRERLSTFAT